jgi:hypothetical protein
MRRNQPEAIRGGQPAVAQRGRSVPQDHREFRAMCSAPGNDLVGSFMAFGSFI